MRILLATDNKELDEYLKKNTDFDIAGEVYYREALVDSLRQHKCDTVILSAFLNGEEDMLDVVFQLRMADARVVMLMGDTNKNSAQVFDLIAMGVYDILFSPIEVSEIIQTIKEPKKLSNILRELHTPWRPESKGLISMLRKFLQRKVKEEAVQPIEPTVQPEAELLVQEEEEYEKTELEEAVTKEKSARGIFAPGFDFFNIKKEEKAIKEDTQVIFDKPIKTANQDFRARAVVVMGTAKNVGSTSFAIALAKALYGKGENVRIVDAGGGAKKWLQNDNIECDSKIGIMPGTITVFDIGSNIPDGVMPFAEYVFIITDNSPDANPTMIMPYQADRTYLIGNKGMDEDIVFALADLKMVKALYSLPKTSELITAEQKGIGVVPQKWRKKIERTIDIIKKERVV